MRNPGWLRWLENSIDQKQVVSTTVQPLFPLVERGLFAEALYYRLNVMLLCVDASGHHGNPAAPFLPIGKSVTDRST